jgi:hypothetical protein
MPLLWEIIGDVVLFVSLMIVPTICLHAQEPDAVRPHKSEYNLFNPTPVAAMRELSPDRPDKTESPHTVDAGHFQLEMDFANFTYSDIDGIGMRSWNLAPFNFKVGLLNNVDLQFVFDNYLRVRVVEPIDGAAATQSGVGDFFARLKINLWGNDGGQTAFALLPFIKFPTSTRSLGNNAIEGGLILPLALNLPGNFEMGLETAIGFLQNDIDHRYHTGFVNSATFDHSIIGKLRGYLEYYSDVGTGPYARWIGTVDMGFTFLLTHNVQLDSGSNFGATGAADAVNPFVGITVRY